MLTRKIDVGNAHIFFMLVEKLKNTCRKIDVSRKIDFINHGLDFNFKLVWNPTIKKLQKKYHLRTCAIFLCF